MPKPRRTVTLPGLLHATPVGGAGGDQRDTAAPSRSSKQHRHIKFWSSGSVLKELHQARKPNRAIDQTRCLLTCGPQSGRSWFSPEFSTDRRAAAVFPQPDKLSFRRLRSWIKRYSGGNITAKAIANV